MRSSFLLAAFAAFTPAIKGLNVLITNDDGFGVANIRELYKQMTGLGHNCYIVASPSALSSTSDQTMFTTSPKLLIDGDWGLTKAGAPSLGTDPHDGHIWYYNGTPAAQVFIALDYVLPKFAGFSQPDLVISGPNFGWNLGPFVYTMTGNLGASYAAIERGIPAISFASGNNVPEPYYWVNTTTEAGLEDPSTITARLAAGLVQALADKASGSRVMPKGYGMSVNLPYITSYKDDQCTNPPFVLARMVTNITDDKAVFDSSTGLFTYGGVTAATGAAQCMSGNCNVPGELDVLNSGCRSSVTVYTVDYNAVNNGVCFNVTDMTTLVPVIVHLNGTTIPGGNSSVSAPPPAQATITSTPPVEISSGSYVRGLSLFLLISAHGLFYSAL